MQKKQLSVSRRLPEVSRFVFCRVYRAILRSTRLPKPAI
jgi:hypothetical protein